MKCQEFEDLLTHRGQLDADLLALQGEELIAATRACDRYCVTLDEYLQVPTLLDPLLPSHTPQLCDVFKARLLFLQEQDAANQKNSSSPSYEARLADLPAKALYTLAKVRGPKLFSTYLPHDVATLRFLFPTIAFASCCFSKDVAWHTRYMLFVWADVAVRAPFPLKTILTPEQITVVIELAQSAALAAPDRVSDSAIQFLARFLSRSDAGNYRSTIITAAKHVVSSSDGQASIAQDGRRTCALSLLAAFFKLANRSDTAPFVTSLLDLLDSEQPGSTAAAHRMAKLATRVALTLLPPRPANWRYSKPSTQLFARGSAAGHDEDVQDTNKSITFNVELNDAAQSTAEQVISYLLEALRHRDSVVRWGASKGVARVTARLPIDLATEVTAAVLALADDPDETQADAAAHGACLCVAELARRGLLLPNTPLFADALTAVRVSARFDLRRGAHSVGAHVRDAACYAVWALARAYARGDIANYASEISAAMLPIALLDREVNCRRAAAAALQECVGRLSDALFPEGIRLVTLADYFALGDRSTAYLSIAPSVVGLAEGVYFLPVLQELWTNKLVHWDSAVRELAASALSKFITVDSGEVILKDILPKLIVQGTATKGEHVFRHGAVHALAGLSGAYSSEQLADCIMNICKVPGILNENGLFSGKSGDEMRMGSCKLMMCIAKSESRSYLLTDPGRQDVEHWLYILERILGCGKEHMYAQATTAYEAVCSSVIVNDLGWYTTVTARILKGLQDSKMYELQRGYALAAGVCRSSAVVHDVVDVLSKIIKENVDVEVRRNAVRSIGRLAPHLSRTHVIQVLRSLTAGMYDFTIDERGDIGSWVREACLCATKEIVTQNIETEVDPSCHDDMEQALTKMFHAVIEQCCGKIDRVRSVAGITLRSICRSFAQSSKLSSLSTTCRQMEDFIGLKNDATCAVDFGKVSSVLPAMARALQIEGINVAILHGILAGGDGPRAHSCLPVIVIRDFIHSASVDVVEVTSWILQQMTRLIVEQHERLFIPSLQVLGACCARNVLSSASRKEGLAVVQAIRASWRGRQREVKRTIAAVRALEDVASLSRCWNNGLDIGANTVARACLEALVVILGAQIPRLRRVAAEAMYMILLRSDAAEIGDTGINDSHVDREPIQALSQALDILTVTSWERVDVAQARERRNSICTALDIQQPVIVRQQKKE